MKRIFALLVIVVLFASASMAMAAQCDQMSVSASGAVKCPICGMQVNPKTAKNKWTYKGKTYYFSACCSKDDIAKFKKAPEKYLKK